MPTIAISIVNLNCLEHTKNLIRDLDRQTFSDYVVYFYDQNSSEEGTADFLRELESRYNYNVKRNSDNIPLNHIWNEFANASHGAKFICFLNNDIRIPSNYLEDSYNVLTKDKRVAIVSHATNNRRFKSATHPTRHILESNDIKQGWDFMMNKSDWVNIPSILKFYCGDDFIFKTQYNRRKKFGIVTSSPVIHKMSKTREAMGPEFTERIKQQALLDIENYKKLGFQHKWNNISSHSKLTPEIDTITEVNLDKSYTLKHTQYSTRLEAHLNDVMDVHGDILDVGVVDVSTFNSLSNIAEKHNKKVFGIDYKIDVPNGIIVNGMKNKSAKNILNTNKSQNYTIWSGGIDKAISNIKTPMCFMFVGIINKFELKHILPKLWDKLSVGGALFFPYYHYNIAPECKDVIDEFLNDNNSEVLCSRAQTKRGVHDTYLVVKKFSTGLEYKKRDKPLVIATVLKSGGIYTEEYANKLASAVRRHISLDIEYRFVCLTDLKQVEQFDLSVIDDIIPLRYDLSGWWSKMELFRPELFIGSQVLYFDLDTLIVDNIDDFTTYGGDFLSMRDFNTLLNMSSGILGWDAMKNNHVFYNFVKSVMSGEVRINQFTGGDQEAIEHFLGYKSQWVQDIFPQKMAPFKYLCYNDTTHEVSIPNGYSVICFHGIPKMDDLRNDSIIIEHWR